MITGMNHTGFVVRNLDKAVEFYRQVLGLKGAQKLNPPVELVPGRRICYLQDPDGNWIELIEAMSRTG